MTACLVLLFVVGSILLLLRFRFRDNFLRAYVLFFLILLVYASNKEYYGISPEMSEGAGSPLNLVRWGLLAIFAWAAWRMKMPAGFRNDVALGTFSAVFISIFSIFVAGSANAFFESWMFSVGNLTSLMYWGAATGVVARWAGRTLEVEAPQSEVVMKPQLSYTR